jgi:hypothetical protein
MKDARSQTHLSRVPTSGGRGPVSAALNMVGLMPVTPSCNADDHAHAQTRHEGAPNETGNEPPVSRVALIRPLAAFCCILAVLTIFWADWIEALTGFDPDQHDGTVEGLIIIALLSTAPYWRSRRAQDGAVPVQSLD